MQILIIILTVFILSYIFRGLTSVVVALIRKKYIKNLNDFKIKEYPKICILLPALREQSIVETTYKAFQKLNYPKDKLNVVFVTTQREEFEYLQKDMPDVVTTSQLVKQQLAKQKVENFSHIHYPFEKGNKSSQLNYAIDELKKKNIIEDDTYIGVFDFDSEPNENLLIDVAKIQNLKHADVIQPVPIFLKNISEISKNRNSFVFAHAMFQQVRALGIETFRLIIKGKKRLTPLYCMGASCFIKTKTLLDCDKFPLVDDIQLGYRMLIRNKSFAYVPTLVEGDLPSTVKAVLKQSILINKGNFSSFKEISLNRKDKNNSNLWGRFLIFWEGFSVLSAKTFLPYLYLALVIYSLISGVYLWFAILVISAPVLRYVFGFISMQIMLNKKVNYATVFMGLFASITWPFFKTYGPFKNIQLNIKSFITKKEIVLGKTER